MLQDKRKVVIMMQSNLLSLFLTFLKAYVEYDLLKVKILKTVVKLCLISYRLIIMYYILQML